MAGPAAYVAKAMHEPTARQVVETFLTKSAEFLADENNPKGCMIAIGTLFSGKDGDQVKQALSAYRQGYEAALKERLDLAKSQKDLPQSVNTADLAKYVATVHQGMSVQAASGATKEALLAVVQQALKIMPD